MTAEMQRRLVESVDLVFEYNLARQHGLGITQKKPKLRFTPRPKFKLDFSRVLLNREAKSNNNMLFLGIKYNQQAIES